MKIILVGAGQLGSRHLQSLAKLNIGPCTIHVIDPSSNALEVAKGRLNEIESTNDVSVSFYESLEITLTNEYQIAIIATSSNIRAKVSEHLLKIKNIQYIVFEKVLFQSVDDYEHIGKLLVNKGVKAWVNHPKRTFPLYRNIRDYLSEANEIEFFASAGNWGLACNCLHLLDLFQYLSRKDVSSINLDGLDRSVCSAKRAGFIEVNGSISGKLGDNGFHIRHFSSPAPLTIHISSDKGSIVLNEKNDSYHMFGPDSDWEVESIDEKTNYFQSELTKQVVEDLIRDGNCKLPTYKESSTLHLKFIGELISFLNKNTPDNYVCCPIT